MNVINYINKYGDYTLDEKELNEIDKLIFGLLSYVKYDGLVSYNSLNKRTINDVGNEYFKIHEKKELKKNIMGIRSAIEVLRKIKDTKRYGNLLLFNDIYIGNDYQQFSALCIEINPNLVYVSFEGTDQLLSGWKEDFKMAYKFPVKAQVNAIKYLNKHFTFNKCNIIVGGHSKGGNLALIASMYCNKFVNRHIKEVYSYDGPGLRKQQIESNKYNKIKNRFRHVVPNNSVVGMLLNTDVENIVVKSNKIAGLSHNAVCWQIEDNNFKIVNPGKGSINFHLRLSKWLDKYNDIEIKRFVDELFKLFKENNITSLIEIMDNYKLILDILKSANHIDPVVKEMAKDMINILLKREKDMEE